jgi:hypothetical protein
MSLQTENRNVPEFGNQDSKVDYQRFEHPTLDLVNYSKVGAGGSLIIGSTKFASARIYCPDVRVISRLACIFQPNDPNTRALYDLSNIKSDIVAYRCMNARSRIARVGEIIGKNGVPFQFPKSNIDGVAFQNDDDMPWIDVDVNLSYPGVSGVWSLFYHATSNNKLKKEEWLGYISRVTMSVQESPGVVYDTVPV